MLLCPVVESAALASPPASPAAGACYLVGPSATGAWAGKDGMLAGYSEGGWRYVAPIEGASVLERTSGQVIMRRAGVWESGIVRAHELQIDGLPVVGERQPAIADPTGGSVVDLQARATVTSVLAALRAHGLIE